MRGTLAEHGFTFDEAEPREAPLAAEDAEDFLRHVMPTLPVPVVLPTAWTSRPARIRADLHARASTGLFAHLDWQLRVGDLGLDETELRRLAAERAPLVHTEGRWQVIRRDDVERALRFLEEKRTGGDLVDLVRATSGLAIDEYGLELGEVSLDERLEGMLDGTRATSRCRRHRGWSTSSTRSRRRATAGCASSATSGSAVCSRTTWGSERPCRRSPMIVSEREQYGSGALGATLVVCPMSVARQWMHEVERFAPGLRVHLHHGGDRLAGERSSRACKRLTW